MRDDGWMSWPSEDEIARQMASDGQHCVSRAVWNDEDNDWVVTTFWQFVRRTH